MLQIKLQNIENLKQEYLIHLKKWFKYDEDCKLTNEVNNGRGASYPKMLEYYRENFDEIILSDYSNLIQIWNDFKSKFEREIIAYEKEDVKKRKALDFGRFKNKMSAYYSAFFSAEISDEEKGAFNEYTHGRWFTKRLRVKVCPYCNHNYIFTINKPKIKLERKKTNLFTRPQLDHFHPKSEFPLLALSFYNLIPSCSVCNSVKSNKKLAKSPYEFDDNNKLSFSLVTKEDKSELLKGGIIDKDNVYVKISAGYSCSDEGNLCNIIGLGLEEIYNEQTDYVGELIDKIQAYNGSYYKSLIESFSSLGKTSAEIDTLIWGVYLDENERRPLSKLTNDILKQLR